MTLEHTPPQLSSEGEQLLADVLAARAARAPVPVLDQRDDAASEEFDAELSDATDAPIHPMTVALPVLIVLGGLLTAAMLSMGLGGQSSGADNVEVEVAGAVEERLQSDGSVDVTMLSLEASNAGIRRFDLRLQAVDLPAPVSADRFHVGVVDQAGNPVTTIVRLPPGDLEPSRFIDAMVRVEGAGSSGDVVSVSLDGIVIEQLLLD